MRDKVIWVIANFVLKFATKRYKESLQLTYKTGLLIWEDPKLADLVEEYLRNRPTT